MIVTNRMKVAIKLCYVALLQYHIKTTVANTFDRVSLSDLNYHSQQSSTGGRILNQGLQREVAFL